MKHERCSLLRSLKVVETSLVRLPEAAPALAPAPASQEAQDQGAKGTILAVRRS